MRAFRRLLVLTALSLLVVPAAASASTLTRAGGVYDYTGTAAANGANISFSVGSFSVTDTESITMAADASCTGENTTSISCTVTPTSIDADFGGGADSGTISNTGLTGVIPLTGQGGSGNDNVNINSNFSTGAGTATLNDSSGNDTLALNVTTISGINSVGYGTVNGGTGTDTVSGTGTVNGDAGNDILRGTSGSSTSVTLNGGTENDTFTMDQSAAEIVNGGSGTDTTDFTAVGGVTVTLDSVQNDGQTGSGNDNANADGSIEILRTGPNSDNLTGGPGNDQLFAGDGADTVNGSGGDDFIDAGFGADVINGGANGAAGDTVDYSLRAFPLRVSPDGIAANDGESAELDNVGSDVENVVGGFNNDSIGGNASNNNFNGGLGEDSFDGAAGSDTLIGGSGDDNLDGAANNDTIQGGPGDDTIDGGADTDNLSGDSGSDLIDGSAGTDTLNGGTGSDTLLTRDSTADTANCGDGTDHSVHDVSGDTINVDCEISDTGAAGFSLDKIGGVQIVTGSNRALALTCISSRAKRSGRASVKCQIALTNAGAGSMLRGRLVRGGRTLAKSARVGSGRLSLRSRRRAARGRYTLVLTQAGQVVARVPIRIR